MKHINLLVSEDAYRQARVWAAINDTSVSAMVEKILSIDHSEAQIGPCPAP